MNKTFTLPLIAAVVAIGVAGGYWAGGHQAASTSGAPAADAAAPAEGGQQSRKILYYRNPMGLPDTSPEPKKDSMGMNYIPVFEGDEPDDSGAVKVSPARLQTLGVKTAAAAEAELDAAVRAVGRIEVNERTVAEVAPKFEGWIEKLYINATGDPVRRGQALFSVYSPELVSAQKELAIARSLKLDTPGADPAARESSRRLENAARERLRNWGVAAGDGKVAQQLTFSSPVNGVVLEKKAVEGMRFAAGTSIFRIADLSTVWVIADVYEQDLARVRVGQKTKVVIEAFPERTFEATVNYLYPTLNASTRTTPVRLELDNRAGLLRPGMFAHVDLATAGATPRLSVPTSAVLDSGERQVVLLVLGEGKYKPQPVKLGLRGRERVEILDGLKVGDQVVVAANFLIDAESNLKAALGNFLAPDAAASKTYQANGSIDTIDMGGNTVSMNHEAIPDLQWPAMTMDFGLAKPDIVQGILPGQAVRFTFEDRGNGEFVITRMKKTEGAAAVPAPADHSAHQGH